MNYVEKLKQDTNYVDDIIYKEIIIGKNLINLINIETITNSDNIHDFILRKISYLDKLTPNDLTNYLYNYLPAPSIKKILNYKQLKDLLLNAYTILIINNQNILAIETKSNLSRGVSEVNYEKSITGPKDAFIEHYNTNIGLIRKRIKNTNLHIKTFNLGKYTKTKIGLMYINDICKEDLVRKISKKLKKINIDGIIDSNYLKRYLNKSNSLFPTLKSTERPDLASISLLEGKVILVVDNSPEVLILPTFFIDFFHASDDYYQKQLNISFIRIIRLIAFIISIFLPAFYIAITTHNLESMPIKLLLSFKNQRATVPFPAFIEAILMIIVFEILRESDIRIPSSMTTAISILGGIVLGDAAVAAGIVSPIMIIVVAISAISGMLMQTIEAVNSIRWYRFILIILSSLLGYFGIFLGIILMETNLSDTKSLDKDYLYPFSPINFKEQADGFIRITNKKTKYRNPILSNNKIRGK